MYRNQFIGRAFILSLCLVFSGAVAAQTQDEESSRQIVLDRFNKARPASDVTAGIGGTRVGPNNATVKPPVYRRTGQVRMPGGRKPAPASSSEEIGVTVWRLRPSQSSDTGRRGLGLDGLKTDR